MADIFRFLHRIGRCDLHPFFLPHINFTFFVYFFCKSNEDNVKQNLFSTYI